MSLDHSFWGTSPIATHHSYISSSLCFRVCFSLFLTFLFFPCPFLLPFLLFQRSCRKPLRFQVSLPKLVNWYLLPGRVPPLFCIDPELYSPALTPPSPLSLCTPIQGGRARLSGPFLSSVIFSRGLAFFSSIALSFLGRFPLYGSWRYWFSVHFFSFFQSFQIGRQVVLFRIFFAPFARHATPWVP